MPNVETNRQMCAELNKTYLLSKFWEVEIPDSSLNLYFQAVADVVGNFWLPFRMFSMTCYDSLPEKYPILNEGD